MEPHRFGLRPRETARGLVPCNDELAWAFCNLPTPVCLPLLSKTKERAVCADTTTTEYMKYLLLYFQEVFFRYFIYIECIALSLHTIYDGGGN